ncbi:hypothetical protein [Neogemmobacter tilapiae]|uniref:Uncharacterized protein n=1 Tax=Neogemmobacter tilapiae TaxID=875041 RepID=A0A918WF99_9RHOB|nr:hypothetical protein [Gemmobacter tilapiae]GHC45727.1 hypothetical protein GCM10007315_04040 [Gemmobacter tilapiae]
MNLEELAATLEAKNLNPDEFGIGEQRDDRFCITDDKYNWAVFHFERGKRSNEVTFATEEQAARYFLSVVDGMIRRGCT